MDTPIVYVDIEGAQPLSRRMKGNGARIAVHVPDADRAVEFHVRPDGRWEVVIGPDAAHAGEFVLVASGGLGAER